MDKNRIENLLNESGSERFQEGLFTAFYAMEKCGLKREQTFKIFKLWKENNPLDSKDYKNLEENYLEFYKQFEAARELYNTQ